MPLESRDTLCAALQRTADAAKLRALHRAWREVARSLAEGVGGLRAGTVWQRPWSSGSTARLACVVSKVSSLVCRNARMQDLACFIKFKTLHLCLGLT